MRARDGKVIDGNIDGILKFGTKAVRLGKRMHREDTQLTPTCRGSAQQKRSRLRTSGY